MASSPTRNNIVNIFLTNILRTQIVSARTSCLDVRRQKQLFSNENWLGGVPSRNNANIDGDNMMQRGLITEGKEATSESLLIAQTPKPQRYEKFLLFSISSSESFISRPNKNLSKGSFGEKGFLVDSGNNGLPFGSSTVSGLLLSWSIFFFSRVVDCAMTFFLFLAMFIEEMIKLTNLQTGQYNTFGEKAKKKVLYSPGCFCPRSTAVFAIFASLPPQTFWVPSLLVPEHVMKKNALFLFGQTTPFAPDLSQCSPSAWIFSSPALCSPGVAALIMIMSFG